MPMDDAKITEVLNRYEDVVPIAIKANEAENHHDRIPHLGHLLEMIPLMRGFLIQGRREKLMRWLGWVQAVLVVTEVYTLDEVKRHNMPTPTKGAK